MDDGGSEVFSVLEKGMLPNQILSLGLYREESSMKEGFLPPSQSLM